jgi:hypothetical protein
MYISLYLYMLIKEIELYQKKKRSSWCRAIKFDLVVRDLDNTILEIMSSVINSIINKKIK